MAVTTDKVAEVFLNVDTSDVLQNDYPAFDVDDIFVYYGLVGLAADYGTDYTITLGNELNDYSFSVTVLAPLKAKIDALLADDDDEENRVVVRRIMQYTTVTTPGAVSGTKFTSQEFDRTAMKLMQIADTGDRAIVLGEQYVNETPPRLTIGLVGEVLVFGSDNKIIPGPSTTTIEGAAANAAQTALDAAATAADRVQTGLDAAATAADRVQTGLDAASALDSKTVALQTKGVFRGAWATATAYAKYDQVRQGTAVYSCLVAHTSGTFATDLSGGKWSVYVQDGPAGAGSGDMSKSTYDTNNVNADAFNMANMVESAAGSGHLKMSTSERSKLSGIEALADVTDAVNVTAALATAASTAYTGTDKFVRLSNAGSLIFNTLTALVTYLATALAGTFAALSHNHDASYAAISHTHSFGDITAKPTTRAGYGITDAAPLAPNGGAVGSYLFAWHSGSSQFTLNEETGGSNLYPCNSDDFPSKGTQRSGTWKCMGQTADVADAGDRRVTLWLRIA